MTLFFIYFPFAVIISGLIYLECKKHNHPGWWPVVAFLAPVTTPYFIFKSRRQEGIRPFIIFLATFSAVCMLELFLYNSYINKNQYNHLPPAARKIIYLSEDVKQSTIALDNALVKLENLSKVEARINEIKKTIDFIKELRVLMVNNQNAIEELVRFTNNNQVLFKGKELEWVFHIQSYYNNRNVVAHYRSLIKYLDEFESLLKYTYVNFYKIRDHKISKILKNYDQYYLRYRRAVDTHNRFNVRRIEFQNDYIKQYPQIKAYLPGERQTETFKLWD